MKHLLTLALFLCLGTFASAQIPGYVPTNGLVGWWPFNGNANDESGNGNHGTVNGATLAADRFGNAGKAYSFDGVDDYILANSININMPATFTFWILPQNNIDLSVTSTGSNSGATILSQGASNNPCNYSDFAFGYKSGNYGTTCCGNSPETNCPNSEWLEAELGNGCGYTYVSNCNNNQNLTGNWQFISLIIKQNQLLRYTNGILLDSISNGKTSLSHSGFPFSVGARYVANASGPYPGKWLGKIDDIAIYNRALTAAEVQQLYLVNCRPTFTAQPQNKSVGQGQTTSFAVQVDTTSTFQWQMDNGFGFVNLVNSSLFSGVTTNTLTVKGSNSIDGYSFRCIATACQSDTSNTATLTVTSNSSTLGSVAGVPGKINYQGAAVDSLGKPMKNQTISLKLSVLDSSSTGAAAYVETHSTPTNGSGIFSLQIGGGTAVTGTFDSIPWANGRNKYLKTEVNQNGTWVNLGTSQLVSVPYALHAGSAENAKNAIFATNANYATFFKDSLGNAYQIKTVNGQPTLVSAPGNVSSPAPFACGQAVTYAGESYPTVQIGTQCWFQKNVNAGTMILGANDQTNNSILEKYCYNNDPANCSVYGGLYQWAEAVQYQNGASNTTSPSPAFTGNVNGICPTGWHVPSDGDWCALTMFLDSSANCSTAVTSISAGGKLKSLSGLWNSPNTGATNSSGYSALPGGYRDTGGTFDGIGINIGFWTTSESSSSNAFDRGLYYGLSNISRGSNNKDFGFSIRCLKD
jgi:uncharacterized protein (TIGR02145 family)